MRLRNHVDLQYHAWLNLGGQPILGIMDTGSFELVVFGKACSSCGKAAEYNPEDSPTFEKGSLRGKHRYGSGWCSAIDGEDVLSISTYTTDHQDIWVTSKCRMPVLSQAHFNSIAGMGPPGQPRRSARKRVEKYERQAEEYQERGEDVPEELERNLESAKLVYEIVREKQAMLENLGVSTFSFCLEKRRYAPGWLIWNDETRQDKPGVLRIPVEGEQTWTVQVSGLTLGNGEQAVPLACSEGCGALLDTGTSLIAVPSRIFKTIFDAVMAFLSHNLGYRASCSTLKGFPDLHLEIAGHRLTLPPAAYIGTYYRRLHKSRQRGGGSSLRSTPLGKTGCKLLLLDTGDRPKSDLGEVLILGMPFFREFYTTYSLGAHPGERAVFISRNSDNCKSQTDAGEREKLARGSYLGRNASVLDSNASVSDSNNSESKAPAELGLKPMRVDASQILTPSWLESYVGRL